MEDVVAMARIGRQSLPGAGAFDVAHAPLLEADDESGCTAADKEGLYATGMATVAAPAAPAARIVHSAGTTSYGFGDTDLLTRVTAALRLYLSHGRGRTVSFLLQIPW